MSEVAALRADPLPVKLETGDADLLDLARAILGGES